MTGKKRKIYKKRKDKKDVEVREKCSGGARKSGIKEIKRGREAKMAVNENELRKELGIHGREQVSEKRNEEENEEEIGVTREKR